MKTPRLLIKIARGPAGKHAADPALERRLQRERQARKQKERSQS